VTRDKRRPEEEPFDMKPESGMELITGLIRFYSMEDMRKYIKELLDGYQRELDRSSNVIGSLLRDKGKKGDEIIKSRGWSKVGGVFVNSMEPELGNMEIVFQMLNEMKPRVAKTDEVLRLFDLVEDLPVEESSTYLLFLRAGVPERIIIDSKVERPSKYAYAAKMRTV
jgi:hypothetical protein